MYLKIVEAAAAFDAPRWAVEERLGQHWAIETLRNIAPYLFSFVVRSKWVANRPIVSTQMRKFWVLYSKFKALVFHHYGRVESPHETAKHRKIVVL